MLRKWSTWVCIVLIIAISVVDIFFFGEAVNVPEGRRKLFHILLLALVMGIGYIPFAKSGIRWTKQLWLISYILVFALIFATGALHAALHWFGSDFMDVIYNIRVSFCGPVPFMAIFVLSTLKGMKGPANPAS